MRIRSQDRRRWARRAATTAAVVLALVGGAAVAVGIADQEPAPPSPAASAPTTSGGEPSAHPTAGAGEKGGDAGSGVPELGYSRPVRIAIPRIGVRSSLVDIGLDAEGVMETPEPVDKAGWFTPSPPPGVPGATVIAGHVTWNQQPSVFFRLGGLHRGDRVRVEREDGKVVVFRVTRIGSFSKKSFPTRAVYSQPDRPELRLITCGGKYDDQSHRYLDNVVVWARVAGVRTG